MTAAELIAALSALPGDSEVMFDCDGEYVEVGACEAIGDSEEHAVLISASAWLAPAGPGRYDDEESR